MKFGQLLRGDADEDRKQLQKLVAVTVPVTQASVSSPLGGPSRLKFVAIKAYGTETHALLHTQAVTNLILWKFCKELALYLTVEELQVTIANGKVVQVEICVEVVSVSCGQLVLTLNLSVVRNAPLDAIIGSPTFESLGEPRLQMSKRNDGGWEE